MNKYNKKKNKTAKTLINNFLMQNKFFHYETNYNVVNDVVYSDRFANVKDLVENSYRNFEQDIQRSTIIVKNNNNINNFSTNTEKHKIKLENIISINSELKDLMSYFHQGWAALTMQYLEKFKEHADESFVQLECNKDESSFIFDEKSVTFSIICYKHLMNPITEKFDDKVYKTETTITLELNKNTKVDDYIFTLKSKITEETQEIYFFPFYWIKKFFNLIKNLFILPKEASQLKKEDVLYKLKPDLKPIATEHTKNSSQFFTPYKDIKDFACSNSKEIIEETKNLCNNIYMPRI